MKQLAEELGLLKLVCKQAGSSNKKPKHNSANQLPADSSQNTLKDSLNKEELRLLVKILKAIGHSCEHQHINIIQGVTHYQLDDTTLVFDDVSKADENKIIHLSPLALMLDDASQKRPTWEKLKALHNG